ncbi:alpha/beta fold hydrolase [Streptomyces albus]|uniref:alpha/beta fold hydrolase n=1 Tax=Streptomyces albus TaxID=1888 RepID=UPI0037029A06
MPHAPAPPRFLTPAALADLAALPATSRWVRSAPPDGPGADGAGGGVPLHVLDYGGTGRPLLILPGITSPAVTMDFVARELTDLVRPLVLDVRGRGLSGDGPCTLEAYARDAEAVVRDLGLERPLLLGHSMGARIAAVTALRGTAEVAGTVLVDPPMSGPGRGPYPTPLAVFLDQLAEARQGTDAARVAHWWPRWPHREQGLRARWLASCGEAAIRETHEGFTSDDFFDVWPKLTVPTVLLYGAESPVVTRAGAAEAARTLPAARLEAVPGAGHMVFWDSPRTALGLLREVLRGLPG